MTLRLYSLLILAALFEQSRGQILRYVLDNDNDLDRYVAFPVGICIKVSMLTSKYVEYTCTDIGVEKRLYTDDACTQLDPAQTTVIYWTDDDKDPCNEGPKYSCTGDDFWVTTGYWMGSSVCAGDPVFELPTVMTPSCFCDDITTSYSLDCAKEPLSGDLIQYDNTDCTGNEIETLDLADCSFALEVTSIEIYQQIIGCRLSYPTQEPTHAPTQPPTVTNLLAVEGLDGIYKYTAVIFVAVFILIGAFSWIDAWFLRINDYFKIGALAAMTIQTMDMLSDCFFSAEVITQWADPFIDADTKTKFLIIFLASVLFIVLPAFLALFQLYSQAKKYWLKNDYVRSWLSKYFTILLFISLATGSSFSAVSLLNSYIFHLEIFDMGLTDKQLKAFNTRRIWSVVVFENMPQLVLQSIYLIVKGGPAIEKVITVSSMAFSFISVIISLMSLTMERAINKTQRSVTISFEVTGDCVQWAVSKCRTMNYKLRKNLAPLLAVDWNVIEVVKPMYITGGLSLNFIVYINDVSVAQDYDKVLKQANADGKLSLLIADAWKLEGTPIIQNIQHVLNQSKQERKDERGRTASFQPVVSTSKGHVVSQNSAERVRVPTLSTVQQDSVSPQADAVTPVDNNAPPPSFNANAKEAKNKGEKAEVEMEPEGAEDAEGDGDGPPPPVYNPNARVVQKRKKSAK